MRLVDLQVQRTAQCIQQLTYPSECETIGESATRACHD
jgi:hypothetical protein